MNPNQTFRYQRIRFVNRVLGLALILTLSALLITLHDKPSKPLPQSNTSTPASHYQKMKLSAAVSLSCPDFEKIFGPNYYTQLSINWSIWSQVASFTQSSSGAQPVVNYVYNVTSQQSYNLYAGSMQRQNCTPAIRAPAKLVPAMTPENSYSPRSLTSNTSTTCNIPLAVQYLNSYNQQYEQLQNSEQAALEDWVNNQPSSPVGLTLSLQQGALSQGAQLNAQTLNLAQQFQSIIGSISC